MRIMNLLLMTLMLLMILSCNSVKAYYIMPKYIKTKNDLIIEYKSAIDVLKANKLIKKEK